MLFKNAWVLRTQAFLSHVRRIPRMLASGMKADVKAEGVGEPRLVPRGGECLVQNE